MLAGLGLAVVAALVTGLVLIGGEASAPPSASDGRIGEACVPPSAPVEVDPLVAEDFYRHDPWTYSGDASESAERLGVWNHTDCCDIGLSSSQGALNDLGCGYGIEAAYRSQDGHTGIAQLILAFGSDIAAFEAEAIDFMSYRMAPDSGIYETDMEIYAYSQAIGQYLVVTIGAIDSTDPAVVDRGKRTLGAFHEDFTTALLLG
ncbi:hypothetical protein LX16_4088 [Stackebrandtia albiflava]|uniref:Uncharacterized protein n=2 Tax=Stackebrandtia albiflava TaxID=406432 RepID=A0A562UYN2_9ACTN|nr:hypothetical protein LX16_4088 [Stackebrandtia albiflava]